VRETAERQEADDDTDDEGTSAAGAAASLTSVRERMWRAFENPHTSIPALVFYYVTGYTVVYALVSSYPCPVRSYFAPASDANYCDEYVRLSVRLSTHVT